LQPKLTLPIFKAIFNFSVQAQQNLAPNRTIGLEGKKILIVGGTGGMGRLFTNFASIGGASVKIVGRTSQRTRKTAKELEVEPGSTSDARASDIIIVAVPMESVVEGSTEVAQFMREGALLTDLSSVKSGIADRISSRVPTGIEYVSIHPLFGPGVDHLEGRSIAAIPFKIGPQWRSFSRALGKAGARIHLMSGEDHDRVMGYVQALHHFAFLSLGVALRKWDGELKTSSIAGTLDRIEGLLDNWDTIVEIQRLNPYSPVVRKEYIETCLQLVGMQQSDVSSVERTLQSNVQKWSRKL
jgi:prephenate dehydrogenase